MVLVTITVLAGLAFTIAHLWLADRTIDHVSHRDGLSWQEAKRKIYERSGDTDSISIDWVAIGMLPQTGGLKLVRALYWLSMPVFVVGLILLVVQFSRGA